ncbi:MAG: TIGR03560 family F420-dependent LLM class oxidoreductase [Rubrobacteraceae bacterium]|nr:TIGR03560 family F420-dependent LLM class oxidoreductase [Rubrobacteraceae bacterium]
MIEVAIMVEGQEGVGWNRWQRLARAVEDSGYAGLYRSDHFPNKRTGSYRDCLELWTSLTWLAENTSRIEFGPLVSPVSFRHPVITAWQASAVDNLAGGRLRLGLGAGWNEWEHETFGFEVLDTDRRFVRFEEGLKVVTRLLRNDEPVSFDGEFYQLRDALLMPRSPRPGGTPVVVGGNGVRRTLPLAARYADEWNAVSLKAEAFMDLNARLDGLVREAGRAPERVRRTLMTRVIFGRTEADVDRKLDGSLRDHLPAAVLAGTTGEIVERLGQLSEAGVQRVILQWLEVDDIDALEAMAHTVLPQLTAG